MTRNPLRLLPLALLLPLLLAAGCQRVAPVRTLPSWVRGIYIPVFKNSTYETFSPGLEELGTRLTQEAFLADGRVDVVPKDQADLVLVVELQDWQARSIRTKTEHISSSDEITLAVGLQLFDPADMSKPMADLGKFMISSNFNIDIRSTRYDPEPDRVNRLMSNVADQIVLKVINGFPVNLPDLPPGASVPQFKTPETIHMDDILQPRSGSDTNP